MISYESGTSVLPRPMITCGVEILRNNTDGSWFGRDDLLSLFDALAALDHKKRMLLARDGTFRVGCSDIAKVLEIGKCLQMTNGVVGVTKRKYRDGWKELLEVQAPEVRDLIMPCEESGGHMMLRATSLNDTLVCISLQHADGMAETELPDLMEVFDLTRTEAMIVHDLFKGHSPQEIARQHDNSVHTIRAHIRRCYDKLGIGCREELWAKLHAYRLA